LTEEQKTTKLGRVVVEDEYATLVFERRLHHSAEEVWRAITVPEELAKWYMTKARIDGRKGGTIDFWSGPSQFHVTGTIIEWDPPRVFEHEWNVEPRPELPKGERAVIRWEIIPGKESVLKLIHRHLTRRTALGFAPGAHGFLDRLEAHLDKSPLPNWMERVEEVRSSYPPMWQ
jgi:uncharacterized protein YndB with AHSA1/START domain